VCFVIHTQTNAVLLPYLVIRPTPSQRRKASKARAEEAPSSFAPLSGVEAFGESRKAAIAFTAVGALSLAWCVGGRPEFGGLSERLGSFAELAGTDRLTFSFLVDLLYFWYFQSWLVADDAARRGFKGSLALVNRVPFFGMAWWFITRPALPGYEPAAKAAGDGKGVVGGKETVAAAKKRT
jgi:hypothetical protein